MHLNEVICNCIVWCNDNLGEVTLAPMKVDLDKGEDRSLDRNIFNISNEEYIRRMITGLK